MQPGFRSAGTFIAVLFGLLSRTLYPALIIVPAKKHFDFGGVKGKRYPWLCWLSWEGGHLARIHA